MKSKIAIALLLIACLVLAGVLISKQRTFEETRHDLESQRAALSKDLTNAMTQLRDQESVNEKLKKEIEARETTIQTISNELSEVKVARAKIESEAQQASQQAQQEIAKRDAKISNLESQLGEQEKQMEELNKSIKGLEGKIASTEKELATTKENREFLLRELKRLQAEKARLEAQFHDLALLREQVRILKDQLATARRLEWIRNGVYATTTGKGGATRQMEGFRKPVPAGTNTDLQVELHLKPDASKTNAPPAPPAPK